jgi:hypothetical protein
MRFFQVESDVVIEIVPTDSYLTIYASPSRHHVDRLLNTLCESGILRVENRFRSARSLNGDSQLI